MPRFTNIQLNHGTGTFRGMRHEDSLGPIRFSARFDLFLVRQAWDRGCDFEDLADGYGPGMGTMGGDWSGIRDSSPAAKERMFERALNHFFGEEA